MDISFLLWLLFTLLSCSSSSDTCGDKSGSTLEIPLISTLNAPLVAQLDIWALTEQLKTLIKNEVRKSVSLAIQESVTTIIENKFSVVEEALQSRINSSLSDSIFELNRRPMFFAFVQADQTVFQGDDVLKFDDVRINRGRHYDSKTGIFTAPKTGDYQVSFLLMGYHQNAVTFQLQKNNDLYYHGYAAKSSWGSQSTTLLMTLQTGDQLYIKHRSSSSEKVQGNRHTFFSARLL